MSTLLETRKVSKFYRMGKVEVPALSDASLSIGEQEFVTISGTSGSGKSTLLNIVGGLDHPSGGQVIFEGRPLVLSNKKKMAQYRRHSVGMIFQNFNLIASMTAADNVALALAFGGVRGRERRRRANDLLSRVGLAERVNHRPAELSGGEQQRVAIARALANRPRLLLADEPSGNLDSTRAEDILRLLRDMVEQDGLTVLLVTHDRELGARFATRNISMKDGRIVEAFDHESTRHLLACVS
ncbi:MAG TPA: ABC transporter ATP-binding protein [Pyrinomonadaceae bacterium]|nr:ABC transporter ATP-binding protein [Pyrinomonadaceae bacterium]